MRQHVLSTFMPFLSYFNNGIDANYQGLKYITKYISNTVTI